MKNKMLGQCWDRTGQVKENWNVVEFQNWGKGG